MEQKSSRLPSIPHKLENVVSVNPSKVNYSHGGTVIKNKTGKLADTFNQRMHIFNIVEQLTHLCRGIQRHRGLSIGLLSGSTTFAEYFNQLQNQLDRRVRLISSLALASDNLLDQQATQTMETAWKTVRHNWQQDSVLENFEFHSHFVEQMLLQVSRLTASIEQPYLQYINQLNDGYSELEVEFAGQYQQMIQFFWRELPPFIELQGKVRALSVHAASVGKVDQEVVKKLAYLAQCIQERKETIYSLTSNLQQLMREKLPSLLTVKIHEYKLDLLLNKIENDILVNTQVEISSEDVFTLASDVIDAYWSSIDDCLGLLRIWQNKDLESWLIEG